MQDATPQSGASNGATDETAALAMVGGSKVRASPTFRFELSAPDLTFERGSFTAIVGESGCGKSTLLDMLALISRPDGADHFHVLGAGDGGSDAMDVMALWRSGDEAALARSRRHVGYILQTGGLLPFLSVQENAALSQRISGQSVDRERIRQLAEQLGIADHLGKGPARLSGGQRQRAAILRAMAHDPVTILADEPTAAVDKSRAVEIIENLCTLVRERGLTLIMVTHDAHLVARRADKIYGFELERLSDDATRSTVRPLTQDEIDSLAGGRR